MGYKLIVLSGMLRPITCLVVSSAAVAMAVRAIEPSPPLSSPTAQEPAASKIAPWVLEHTAGAKQAEFLIVLADQANLRDADELESKEEKGRFVRDALWNKARSTQGALLKWLTEHNVEHRSYYVVNMVWVKGGLELAKKISARPEVRRIEGNPVIRNIPDSLAVLQKTTSGAKPGTVSVIEPGVVYTRAPEVWALGYTGQSVVVGGAGTGYRWTHVALKNHYRGWDGMNADHDYNWHDSIHTGGGICGADSPQPCDDNGLGTHTMGTAVGDDGGGNQIGMAPGAKWIGCRNMDQGNGTPVTYMECLEFFLAPYPVGGTPAEGDPSKAPHVTVNSWSCPASEGCSVTTLQSAIEAQRSAGIVTIAPAGAGGPACSTVSDPPAIYDAAYTVGALSTGTDVITGFSGRGPVTVDSSSRLKPDITAPGINTRSAYRSSDTSYASFSGTSMADSHIAGAVALLLSARPDLKRDVSMTRSILNHSAVHILNSTCDGGGPGVSPNNTYGYGRVDVRSAVLLLTAAVSRKNHGAAGTFDIDLPLNENPGIECRSSGGNHLLVFTFTNAVVSGAASVESGIGSVSGPPVFSGNTMTVNLSSVANVQTLTVRLSNVTDQFSQVLPDALPSITLLIGDTSGNGSVNASDIAQTKSQIGQLVTAGNFRTDINVSGTINASDVSIIKSRIGTSIP
jgi:serine protease AprX